MPTVGTEKHKYTDKQAQTRTQTHTHTHKHRHSHTKSHRAPKEHPATRALCAVGVSALSRSNPLAENNSQSGKLKLPDFGSTAQKPHTWTFGAWFLGRPGSADSGGPDNLDGTKTPSDRWAAKRPPGWKRILPRRGRLDPSQRRSPVGRKTMHYNPKYTRLRLEPSRATRSALQTS